MVVGGKNQDPITVMLRDKEELYILKDGTLRLGETGALSEKLTAGRTLVIEGDGAGSGVVIDDRIAPRIQVMTQKPLFVVGEFTLAKESKQSALFNTNQVNLVSIDGLERPRMGRDKLPQYTLTVPPTSRKLRENVEKKKDGPEERSKSFTVGSGNNSRTVTVEDGARVDFVNVSGGRAEHLLTLLGADTMEDAAFRLNDASRQAIEKAGGVLNKDNQLPDSEFAELKARYGIPEDAAQGEVRYRFSGTIDQAKPATLPIEGVAAKEDKPEDIAKVHTLILDKINGFKKNGFIQGKYDVNANGQGLTNRKEPIETPSGQQLTQTLDDILENARVGVLANADGTNVKQQHLTEVYNGLTRFEKQLNCVQDHCVQVLKRQGKIKEGEEGDPAKWKLDGNTPLNNTTKSVLEMKRDIADIRQKMGETQALQMPFIPPVKIGMQTGETAAQEKFAGLELPGDMPKLAVAEAGDVPAPLAGALPRIAGFLKKSANRTGGGGQAA